MSRSRQASKIDRVMLSVHTSFDVFCGDGMPEHVTWRCGRRVSDRDMNGRDTKACSGQIVIQLGIRSLCWYKKSHGLVGRADLGRGPIRYQLSRRRAWTRVLAVLTKDYGMQGP
jgi:hypothetical protein